MCKVINYLLFVYIISISTNALAINQTDLFFKNIFTDWTNNFNQKNVSKSCALFSKQVVADYQGISQKNYNSICNGFKKIFTLQNQRYQYRFTLHHVYRSGNLAALRITWYLRLYENEKLKSITQDEGIDILEKNKAGEWKIVNYIAYGKDIKI